jgi:hypothetical protein
VKVLYAGPETELMMRRSSGEDRKPGLHLSDVLKRMAYEKDAKYHPDSPMDMMAVECGYTWEEVLEGALRARHESPGYRPDQIQEDGIWMSPDWLAPKAAVLAEEWKATRKSSKNWEAKLEEWLPQAKCYIRALLRRKLIDRPVMRFRPWFMMGDWSFEAKSDLTLLRDYWRIDVEFDKRELEEMWRRVLSDARRFGLLKAAPELAERRKSSLSVISRNSTGKTHSAGLESAACHSDEEKRCQKTISQSKKSGSQQPSSRGKVLAGMFPNTKLSRSRRDE